MRLLPQAARRGLARLRVFALWITGALWRARRQLEREGAVIVLTFHRVLEEKDLLRTASLPHIIVRDRTFRELVECVARKYRPVGLDEAKPGARGGKLQIAFTFDDGWSDNHAAVLVARRHGIPVTVFVCPGLVGAQAPFWPERAIALLRKLRPGIAAQESEVVIEALKCLAPEQRDTFLADLERKAGEKAVCSEADATLTWDEIRAMAAAGVKFGSHTQTHQILTAVPEGIARSEIRHSRAELRERLGYCDLFAYSNGNFSEETRRMLAEEGYQLAFTTEPGAWTAATDPLMIPRLNMSEDNVTGPTRHFSPATFEYHVIWRAWRTRKAPAPAAQPNRRPASATA